jgi:energy-coupling factor transporter ATP-binding protein EcfA2
MPETLLFIGPKSAKALIDELQRRVEPLLRGRWTFEQMFVGTLTDGDLGEADEARVTRRLGRKDRPLPVVVWNEAGAIGKNVFTTLGLPDEERAVVSAAQLKILGDVPTPMKLRTVFRADGPDLVNVLVNVAPFGVRVSGVHYNASFPQHPPLTEAGAWEKVAGSVAEVIQQAYRRPLHGVEIRAFGPFRALNLTFCSGINVLLGRNSTGKSWLMKLLYGALRASNADGDGLTVSERLRHRLARLYRPDDGRVGRLVKRGKGRGQANIKVVQRPYTLQFSISTRDQLKVVSGMPEEPNDDFNKLNPGSPIYVPSRDALALYEGFISTYNGRELSLDETVYDLCVALSAAPLRGPRSAFAKSTLDELERTLGGSIRLKGNRFYLVSNDGQDGLEAHLLSEGLRKVGTLAQLITNGTLQRGSILFWDEPEANLNPRLIVQMAEVLRQLAALGVQVFLATHDYLLTQRLSMEVEYKQTKVPLRFISLYRDEEGEICAEQGDTLVDLEHNDIQDEFRLLYEHELNLAAGINEESGA